MLRRIRAAARGVDQKSCACGKTPQPADDQLFDVAFCNDCYRFFDGIEEAERRKIVNRVSGLRVRPSARQMRRSTRHPNALYQYAPGSNAHAMSWSIAVEALLGFDSMMTLVCVEWWLGHLARVAIRLVAVLLALLCLAVNAVTRRVRAIVPPQEILRVRSESALRGPPRGLVAA